MTKLSIIIPTLNRYDDLSNTIDDLIHQEFKEIEIIIIDQSDEGAEGKLNFLKKHGNNEVIYHIYSNIKSASNARNQGISASKSEYVLFLDDDVVIKNKSFLSNFIHILESEDVSGVVGPIIDFSNPIRRDNRHKWSYNKNWGWLFFPRNYTKDCYINDGGAGNLCVKRKQALEIGGMDENFDKGAHREESDFNYRYTQKFGWYKYAAKCELLHIGSKKGGIRNWKQSTVKAQQHFNGAFYFIFKNIPLRFYPIHLFATVNYFFIRKDILSNPLNILGTSFRMMKGIANGVKLNIRGPKYLLRRQKD